MPQLISTPGGITLVMAKSTSKKRARRFRKYLRGVINSELTFGSIAAKAANSTDMPDTVFEKTWCSAMLATWSLGNFTKVADAGPVLVGVAHNDYTSAEIEEFLENTDSWNEGNLVQQEISKRKIRIVGSFQDPANALDSVVLNDGKQIRTKIGWSIASGQTLKVWVYNQGGVGFSGATTARINVRGHCNLWPQ